MYVYTHDPQVLHFSAQELIPLRFISSVLLIHTDGECVPCAITVFEYEKMAASGTDSCMLGPGLSAPLFTDNFTIENDKRNLFLVAELSHQLQDWADVFEQQ